MGACGDLFTTSIGNWPLTERHSYYSLILFDYISITKERFNLLIKILIFYLQIFNFLFNSTAFCETEIGDTNNLVRSLHRNSLPVWSE